jgi:hypothetical protein
MTGTGNRQTRENLVYTPDGTMGDGEFHPPASFLSPVPFSPSSPYERTGCTMFLSINTEYFR